MSTDITGLHYWMDIAIKIAIGVLVSIIGMDYRAMKNSLKELEENKYKLTAEVQLVENRLDRIEGKLDRVLSR
jgi:hypothetical protein